MNDVVAPLLIALTGVPALAIAVWSGRDGSPHARGTGLRWALIALSMFVGALAIYLANPHRGLTYTAVIVLVIAVNALGISLLRHLRRSPRT